MHPHPLLLIITLLAALLDAPSASAGLSECTGPPDGTPCLDDDACTTGDACVAGECLGGPPVVCFQDANLCAQNVCDPVQGACSPINVPGS